MVETLRALRALLPFESETPPPLQLAGIQDVPRSLLATIFVLALQLHEDAMRQHCADEDDSAAPLRRCDPRRYARLCFTPGLPVLPCLFVNESHSLCLLRNLRYRL